MLCGVKVSLVMEDVTKKKFAHYESEEAAHQLFNRVTGKCNLSIEKYSNKDVSSDYQQCQFKLSVLSSPNRF